jgi:hypothetical protein
MRLFSRRVVPVADRDTRGRFLPGNRYRMVEQVRSIGGVSYTRRVNGASGKTVSYTRDRGQGNRR